MSNIYKIIWAGISAFSLMVTVIITGSAFIDTTDSKASVIYAFMFIGLFWGLWLAGNYLRDTIYNYKD